MNAAELRTFLCERFSETELRTLVFDLRIPYEDLGGAEVGKEGRIQALIEWCVRRGRLDELLASASRERQPMAAPGYVAFGQPRAAEAMTETLATWQFERLMKHMDEMREDLAELVTKTEVLGQRLGALERRLDQIDQHAAPVGWQSWAMAVVGLIMAVVTVMAVVQLMTGSR